MPLSHVGRRDTLRNAWMSASVMLHRGRSGPLECLERAARVAGADPIPCRRGAAEHDRNEPKVTDAACCANVGFRIKHELGATCFVHSYASQIFFKA
ncbi:MAG: hypothetical protein AAFV49_14565, partial [Pseudomonadota bacterium]